jgi:hypothetical protein
LRRAGGPCVCEQRLIVLDEARGVDEVRLPPKSTSLRSRVRTMSRPSGHFAGAHEFDRRRHPGVGSTGVPVRCESAPLVKLRVVPSGLDV